MCPVVNRTKRVSGRSDAELDPPLLLVERLIGEDAKAGALGQNFSAVPDRAWGCLANLTAKSCRESLTAARSRNPAGFFIAVVITTT